MVVAPRCLGVKVHALPAIRMGVNSDHLCLLASVPTKLVPDTSNQIRAARWEPNGDWVAAFQPVKVSLESIAGWAEVAMRCEEIQGWAVQDIKRNLRQCILDRAVW